MFIVTVTAKVKMSVRHVLSVSLASLFAAKLGVLMYYNIINQSKCKQSGHTGRNSLSLTLTSYVVTFTVTFKYLSKYTTGGKVVCPVG